MKKFVCISMLLAMNLFISYYGICQDFVLDSHTKYTGDFKISDVRFMPGDEKIAVLDAGALYLWDIKTKSLVNRVGSEYGVITKLFISSDGKYIASSPNYPISQIFNGQTGDLLYTFRHIMTYDRSVDLENPLNSIAFSPDDKSILTTFNEKVFIWDIATQKLIQQFNLDRVGRMSGARYFPDGKQFISSGWIDNIYTNIIVDIESKQIKRKSFPGNEQQFYSIDMKYIGTNSIVGQDKKIRIWNIETNELVLDKIIPAYGDLIDLSIDKKFAVIGDNLAEPGKRCWLYDLNNSRIAKDNFININSEESSKKISVVRFSNDLKYVAIAIDGKLFVYDISSITAGVSNDVMKSN